MTHAPNQNANEFEKFVESRRSPAFDPINYAWSPFDFRVIDVWYPRFICKFGAVFEWETPLLSKSTKYGPNPIDLGGNHIRKSNLNKDPNFNVCLDEKWILSLRSATGLKWFWNEDVYRGKIPLIRAEIHVKVWNGRAAPDSSSRSWATGLIRAEIARNSKFALMPFKENGTAPACICLLYRN